MKISDLKISVCMATYNGEKYIKEQLESILPQLSADDEVIISDDGSTDGTCSIILSYLDPRIRLFQNKPNLTTNQKRYKSYMVAKNFENALCHATGDYIFLADQDDIWERNKLSSVMPLFKGDVHLIVHDATVVDQNSEVILPSYFNILNSKKGFAKNIYKNSYLGCCMVFDKIILVKSLPFPKNLIAHDMWIGLIAENLGQVSFIEDKLIKYRRHSETATTSGKRSQQKLIFRLQYRFELIIQYIERVILIKLRKQSTGN